MPIGQALEPRDRLILSSDQRVQGYWFPKEKSGSSEQKEGERVLGRHD